MFVSPFYNVNKTISHCSKSLKLATEGNNVKRVSWRSIPIPRRFGILHNEERHILR